ncbi:MAG: hypothetical protein A3I68_04345 [Candidatus Melainabacteria bacterium RIFCSPLOWO2_02_FULL_35_15]|nr:MAG: hypothetical protein A3F80_06215 [Candidatus Melainabacteria bacterium RIFCSPLOWO2_12_FULL_35_11]OGI14486.1 MAG: hypothetical protein A3I68_04345 [Candidatus Melainabacteria bacterium RIFCSPLOWO2_02_FULL_35_15]
MAEISGVLTAGRRQASGAQADRVSGTKTKFQEAAENSRTAKVILGAGAASLVGAGFAFRDGLNEGLKKIGDFGETLSSLFAIPATFLTPIGLAYGEYEEHKERGLGEKNGSRLLEIVYPILSIAFAPMTAFHPLKKAAESKLHLTTTLINMPHIVFTFFSYTGGRFLTLLKSLRLLFKNLSDEEKMKDENERKILSELGDIGSDNAGVTPGAHQFATGVQIISNLLRGDISSVKEKFKEGPVNAFLSTFVSSIFWIPIFIGKSFDTVIRTLEMTDRLGNAIPQDSKIFKLAIKGKEAWHKKSASNSFWGQILHLGRNFGKISQAIASPIGMISVVFPVFDHFFKHGFNNEEAKDLSGPFGGTVKTLDRILNVGALLGHLYFTTLYGLFVRLPQTIVTSTFYGCKMLNNLRGVTNPKDSRYFSASKIRDRIFNPNKGWIKFISDFAANKLEKLVGKRTMYDSIYKILADEECYKPLREKLFKEEGINKKHEYKVIDKETNQEVKVTKKAGEIPPNILWAQILEKRRENIINDSRARFEKYLLETMRLDRKYKEVFFSKVYPKIKQELEIIIDNEIRKYSEADNKNVSDNESSSTKSRLESRSFFDMILHPIRYCNDIKKVFKLNTTLARFVVSPLNLLEFVNMIELGDEEGLPEEINEKIMQECSIRNGDYRAGNVGELKPVYFHAVQTAGKGLAKIARLVA